MSKPKLQIIVLFQNLAPERTYYARCPAPPLTGLLLAALTPDIVEVEVLHEMVRPIDYETDADFVALSFMDFCTPHAIRVAERFRRLGKKVIAGGRYATTHPQCVVPHFDATVVGEAESVWPAVVEDLVAGRLRSVYEAPLTPTLAGIPPPRYDVAEPEFAAPVVTEATRGCPFRCSYCQLNIQRRAFRTRPIEDVVRDLQAAASLPWHRRQLAMFYDNNFGGDMAYAKELLREIARLDFVGVGFQFSFNCLRDDEFVDLLQQANGIMAFVGLESLNQASLDGLAKRQNRVVDYTEQFAKLRARGIMSFTGMMVALEENTAEYYEELPARLREVDPSAFLLSISIPIPGTPFQRELAAQNRILDTDLAHYDGDHLVFEPRHVSGEQVLAAVERISRSFYAWPQIVVRGFRLVASYLGGDWVSSRRWMRSLVLAVLFFKVSWFQRHHALEKVFGRSHELTDSTDVARKKAS